jgi:hypothetical protein
MAQKQTTDQAIGNRPSAALTQFTPQNADARQVSARAFGIEKDLGAMGADEFVAALKVEIEGRGENTVKEGFDKTA